MTGVSLAPRPPAMTTLLPGTRVRARDLEWEIVHSEPAGAQHRYRLRCVQGSLRGQEFDLLHPFEAVDPVQTELDPTRPARLKDWLLYHQAFLLEQQLGPAALLAAEPGRLEIQPYQLVPVLRALQMGRPRLLLADGVGLGKTIQAGLVMVELIARRRAHRILVVSPPGVLLQQWHTEMRDRFGLRFETLANASELQERRRQLELGANPFDHASLCLTSIDFAKQERVLQELERTTWDLVVIDEAHHCVKMSSGVEWDDSRRRRVAEVLAQKSDGLLLLTATPHDGFDPHFASLVELLDPSLVDGRGNLRGESYHRFQVRRLKHHIKDPKTGKDLFPQREVTPRPVRFDPEADAPFAKLQRELLALVAPVVRRARRQRRYDELLAFLALLKRSVSTVAACRATLTHVRDRYLELRRQGTEQQEARRQRLRTLRDLERRHARYGTLSFEEEQDQALLFAQEIAAELAAVPAEEQPAAIAERRADEQRAQRRDRRKLEGKDELASALDDLVQLAAAAETDDPKLAAMLQAIRDIRAAEPGANVLIYTEYTDSLEALVASLQAAKQAGRLDGEILAIRGSYSDSDRAKVTTRFTSEDGLILVSTDATAEGLNLHARCHHLLHLELPYNPNRLEQRNGRIDRYGQAHTPKVGYLYLQRTFEERVLLRLIAKYERQRDRLTFVPDTLGRASAADAGSERLLDALVEEQDGQLFARPRTEIQFGAAADTNDNESDATKTLLDEIDRATRSFTDAAKANSWLGLAGERAEKRYVEEASAASAAGRSLAGTDLLQFVKSALERDVGSADAIRTEPDGTLSLRLPTDWGLRLDGMAGYDRDAGLLRVSVDRSRAADAQKRPLGFLGRAHPVVARALERTRNARYGEADAWVDVRTSAVTAPVPEPELLVTFLGRIEGPQGSVFERVLAVRLRRRAKPEVLPTPQQWLDLCGLDRATPAKGLWDKHFAWATDRSTAAAAAAVAFAPLASEFLQGHADELARDRSDLEAWLLARSQAITGSITVAQGSLFEGAVAKSWRTSHDPMTRLAGCAADESLPRSTREEASAAVHTHQRRAAELERLGRLTPLPPLPLGLLMLLPEGGIR
jgi:ERCC4-related helicase